MVMMEISFSSDAPHFSQDNLIFNRHYIFEFEWIEHERYWVMHLFDTALEPIVLGVKVSTNWPIFYDQAANIVFILTPKHPQTQLTLSSLHKNFTLVVYAPV
jgi:hypothetical protein